MEKIKIESKFFNLEAILWSAGLLYLAFIDPYQSGHLDFCLFKLVGIEFCPGCGLGKSISMIFHGDLIHSIMCHPLGIFAFIFIGARIISLINSTLKNKKISYEVNHA